MKVMNYDEAIEYAFVTTEDRCSNCKSKLTNAETARLNWQTEAFRLNLRIKELEAQLQQLSGWRERLIKVLDVDLCEWMRKEGYSADFAEMKKNDLLELL